MEKPIQSSELHRLAKLIIDAGEAETVEEAVQILESYRLGIIVDGGVVRSPAYQAALLTAVNTGRRCFLGGVQVSGDLDIPLIVPWRRCSTLAEAVSDLQGQRVGELFPDLPLIFLGGQTLNETVDFAIRPVIHGWSGGVLPAGDNISFIDEETFTPAGVLAGALAVSEAFQFIRGDNPLCGHRSIGTSLWRPDPQIDWLNADPGPKPAYLPAKLWLIGLGHLGQAYLWTLGFLPYPVGSNVNLVLQDIDALEKANDSTSLLTNLSQLKTKKTRAMATWCEERGFQTNLIERPFVDGFTINPEEPALALCGVDNIEARRALEKVGFKRVIDAGLGKGPQGYLALSIHTFPASRPAEQCWKTGNDTNQPMDGVTAQPAYKKLHDEGMDRCGLIELAGRSVGASFVGAVASSIVIAQVLRLLRGENLDELITGDLRSSTLLSCVISNTTLGPLFNPGMIRL